MRILLVEDHQDTARVVTRSLERAGHAVTCASGAADASRLCQEQRFDLLISDISLLDGDGWSLMRDLHAACGLRGIAVSGRAYDTDIQRSREVGFLEHLSKPITIDALLASIDRVTPHLPTRDEDAGPTPDGRTTLS